MKRENLFRGKRPNSGKWIQGYLFENDLSSWILSEKFPTPECSCEVLAETVGQFTGAFDAQINGEMVFKDDIIENCDTNELQIVYWNEDKLAWYCKYLYNFNRIVSLADSLGNLNKKVGNIHDNPELI